MKRAGHYTREDSFEQTLRKVQEGSMICQTSDYVQWRVMSLSLDGKLIRS